jgi:hypothetical protein
MNRKVIRARIQIVKFLTFAHQTMCYKGLFLERPTVSHITTFVVCLINVGQQVSGHKVFNFEQLI